MKAGIVGAGILGRLLAIELLHAGWDVTVFDKRKNDNCSMAAAGLLTPMTELEKNGIEIYNLGIEALQQYWPAILERLKCQVYFQQRGSLVLAHPRDQADLLRCVQQITMKLSHTDEIRKLNQADISALEPEVTKFTSGYFFPVEGQIDSQFLMESLENYLVSNHVVWQEDNLVETIKPNSISTRNNTYLFDMVLDCRGLGAKSAFHDLRSVRGELIWLHAPDVNVTRPIRFLHPRYNLYIAPRPKHIYLIGASEIESDDMSHITVRTTLELLTAAYSVHPGFAEAQIIKTVTQCRPTLSHHLPKIKFADGLIAVNGLYRHGYLIAPTLVAEIISFIQHGDSSLQYAEFWEKCA